jgi:endonuclease/exonuclease/phosphatase family metal-dependent hydrolase
MVYVPHQEQEKAAFLQELRSIRSSHVGPWLLCGDFNFIYKAQDKNNQRLNQ